MPFVVTISLVMILAPPNINVSVSLLIEMPNSFSNTVFTDLPFKDMAVTESAFIGKTCCFKISESASGLANKVFTNLSPIAANAVSVGANTVKDPDSSDNTLSKPVRSKAVIKVVNSPLAFAVSTIFAPDSVGAGGINTASITCITPLSAITSVLVTVLVFIKRSSPESESAIFAPFTVTTVLPVADSASSATTLLPSTW